jgi:hypothetical protein
MGDKNPKANKKQAAQKDFKQKSELDRKKQAAAAKQTPTAAKKK